MRNIIDKAPAPVRGAADWLVARCARLPRHTLAWSSIALALILLLSVNLFASTTLRNAKADLTQQGLYTMSEGTRQMLRAIDEPISVRLYYSKRLGEAASNYGRFFERVRALLQQYRDISGGKLDVAIFDPEPFSDAEDRAVASGLRGVRLNQDGETGYFGLVGSNATDNEATIPFFTTDREPFVEYDITKLIYSLANPKKRVVGLITGLPLEGGMNPMAMMGGGRTLPPQMITEQIRDFFEIRTLTQDLKEIPADVDVLMVAQPDRLTADAAYAIDQYVLGGGKVLAFVDPVAEAGGRPGPMGMGAGGPPSPEFIKLLKSWGIDFDPSKVVGDIANARRVQFGGGARPVVTEYVAWLGLTRANIDEKDVLSGGVERLNFASSGFLSKADGATTQVAPILLTSPQAMQIAAEKLQMAPDPVGLLRAYKPEGKPLMLAARITGPANSAYPDGAPKPPPKSDEAKAPDDKAKEDAPNANAPTPDQPKAVEAPAAPAKPHKASGRVNAIVIADSDLLADQFWVDVRDFLGQQVAVPSASNAAFVVNALDNLSGSESLISLRGRGADNRPFQLVDELRRDAERRYREKEQTLTAKLKEVQDQLAKLESAGEGSGVILSEADRQAIEKFRGDMLSVRRELREVKRALREDIDRLDGWLKFTNIALVPLLIGVGGAGWAAFRRRRVAAPKNGDQGETS